MAGQMDVAIIGMACRFPGADDISAFWRLLSEGREGITRFSRTELAEAGIPARLLDDPSYVPAHGVLPDIDLFDTNYFEYTPAEAEMIDPQHRILLQTGHAALEDAGYDPARFPGLISVYAGAAINTYLQQQVLPRVDQTSTANHFAVMVGNDKDFLATRLSYKLDLKGPSYTVQTACSTSLVAIHLACQGLINGECDMALAGGVTVKLPQTKGYLYEDGAILSKDGYVRTFDAEASGTVLGNGVGVLVLKPLREAIADRDTIHAVIKGTATNNDGAGKVSFAAPGVAGQAAVIREAHTVAGVDPRSIGYIEAHGTATRLGDPAEVSALAKAFAAGTRDVGFCAIGTVKSNLGHLDAAAGVAGVIKATLMMRHRTLVPTLNFRSANPAIDFAATPFTVSTDAAPWTAEGPLRAGVSSFGIGGTNAHAVLQEAPPAPVAGASRATQVLVCSARTPTALRTVATNLADHLVDDDRPAADIAYTLAVGRRRHEYRIAVTGSDNAALARALRAAQVPEHPAAGVVSFVFTEELADAEDLARQWRVEPAFAEHYDAALAHGPVFAVQYAMARCWLDWGIRPAAGHGDGIGARIAARLADETPASGGFPMRGTDEAVRGLALSAADGLWAGVARAWAAGADVDWAAWFAAELRGRVPLPTYPFEGRRCWLDGPIAPVAVGGPHPMLDENVSDLDGAAYRSSRSGDEFYLADHRVGGEPVMPAVGYLELARAAGVLALGAPVRLTDVSFEQPLSYAAGPRTALVSLWRERDTVGFEVTDDGNVHASGRLRDDPIEPAAPIDPAALADRCTDLLAAVTGYAALRGYGLDYGPRMRALTEVVLGADVALATLTPPEGSALDGALLNPALLDGALHALVLTLAQSYQDVDGFLPMALGELIAYEAVSGPCHAWVTVGQRGDRSATADITLIAPDGRVLARLRDLVVRVLRGSRRSALLTRSWADAPLTGAATPIHGAGVVIAENAERRERLADIIAARGVTDLANAAVVVVDEPEPEQALEVVRHLLSSRPTTPVRVLLTHRHDATGPRPEYAALGAFARTMRAENPLLAVQAVGLGVDVDELTALSGELAGPGTDPEVMYVSSGRRVPVLVAAPDAPGVPIRDGGVYLITGGAGGLGRLVADWLLSQADAQVVLIGRGVEPPHGLDPRMIYRSADVTDPERLAAIRAEFGPFNGIVHAAGVLRDGFALNKSAVDFTDVLAPKVTGIRELDAVTAEDPLDFFVAFSSIAAHIGNAGQTDYAYANAYLESYAERSGRVSAIAWPLWAEGGMRQSAEAAAENSARTGFGVLPTADGLALLPHALGASGALVAAYGDLDKITAGITTPVAAPPRGGGTGDGDGDGDRAAALLLLRTLVAAQTGLDPDELSQDQPFDRYGIDSLVITQLNRELDKHVPGLSKTLFFEYSTLGELADFFAEHHAHALHGERAQAPIEHAVRPSRSRPLPSSTPEDTAIAVIGVAGRYPMADDLDEFWANLAAGRDCVTEIPADRWDADRWYDPDPAALGRAHTRWGGFLRDVDRFDPVFFGISPRQAEIMDPQERLFLQCAWHTLEDSGYRRAELSGRAVGVYVGVMYGEYQFHGAVDALRGGRELTGSSFATIANRVSHVFGLTGPSMALDTMCSSSLTAIHLACESLRGGESELAIAGGVNVSVHPYKYAFLSQGRYLSSDGRCRAFGAGGDGYVPGEGVGAVLLKPYRQALVDGDRIHGVILASALNHGGRTNGYTVPSPHAQQKVIGTALNRAGLHPSDIDYIEAHGTGTNLGDPIELTGLTNAYSDAQVGPGAWPIGSVKSNIGHLESAAGVAGLTKVLLQFEHQTLVPSLHSSELNPNIDFARSPFRVQRELAPWPDRDRPRRAGLSSFGAGGANAHLVVEESPRRDLSAATPAGAQQADDPLLYLLSARDEQRLREYAGQAAEFLDTERIPLADLCFTTQVGREAMASRFAVLATDGAQIVAALRRFAEGGPATEIAGTGPLAESARNWLAGQDVDWLAWHESHPGPTPRRVRAPRYPFASERYWLPLEPDLGTSALHPLVDANESTVAETRFRKTLRAGDPLVRDHIVAGRPVLAGAVTVEFVRAAADLAEPTVRHAVRDLVWGQAAELSSSALDLYVSFLPDLSFEVYSAPSGARLTHARGRAVALPSEVAQAQDVDQVRERLTPVRDRAGAYADYHAAGLDYGPAYQVIEEIRAGSDEALVRLGAASPAALLDGALRACHWIGGSITPDEVAVPFSLGALNAFGELDAVRSAHSRLTAEQAGVRHFDLTLYDEHGHVLAQIRDFVGRSMSSAPAGEIRCYAPQWEVTGEPVPGRSTDTLALLGPELETAAARLWRRVIPLPTGSVAGDLDVAIVLEPSGADPATELDRVCARVLDLLGAVTSGALSGKVRCVLVYEGRDRPEHGALTGFARSTGAVAPRFELSTLAVEPGLSAEELADAVAAELRSGAGTAGLEVSRTATGERAVRVLRPVTGGEGPVLRDEGVYVITGGNGAIGRVLAEHLARRYRATLVLIGRGEPDLAWHRSLAELGAQVHAVRADVTRADELDAALADARSRFGALHGVFHLAGVADEERLATEDRARFARVLAAKTHGLVNLDRLTREDELDLFVVFSSISSVIGDFGSASYATANRFADLYLCDRVGPGVGISLDWPLWAVGGVDDLVSDAELAHYVRRTGMRPLSGEAGVAVFEHALAVGAPWQVPTWGDPATVSAALAPVTPRSPEARIADGARGKVVEHLRGVLAGVLKLPVGRLDSRVVLQDYGMESVLIMDASALLAKDFPGLSGSVFFEHRTVEELTDHILVEHPDAVAALFPAPIQSPARGESSAPVERPAPVVEVASAPRAAVSDEPIAIIGISGRYPQAADLDEFWRNLVAGRDCVTEVPADRWDATALYDEAPAAPGHSHGRWGGFMSDVDCFDSLFFQIAPKQARSMDPQERLFLETAWSALEDAGYPPGRIPPPAFGREGHDVGVFVGVMWDDYAVLGATESARGNHQVVLANRSSIANQVSYFGDFRGPSVVIDTACSASLVAVHQACESIRRGECAYAIAGGVNVAVHPDRYVHLSSKSMLATDGRCRAFGAGGTGYVPGEGVGAVLLKRLSDAVRDGDTVHAVIRASVVNHGGRTSGYTVPNPKAQQALVEQALATSGIDARSIGYVEAHGTGTALGDPIEHTGLAKAFANYTGDVGFCALGSVKSGIGHLEGAAGIAGLTKVVLQLRYATLAPTLHADQLNPAIDFEHSPFTVQREAAPWPAPRDSPRRASVSSFGAGGTNAFVIVEEYVPDAPADPDSPELIVLSARDEQRLRRYASDLAQAVTGPLRLTDIAYTLRIGRPELAQRLAFVAADRVDAAAKLAAIGRGEVGQWLHQGRVEQHPSLSGLFAEGVGGAEFLAAQIEAGADDLLGRMWVAGITVDWDLADRLRPRPRRRVPLPTYPFERVRHWLDIAPTAVVRQPEHTLSANAPVLRDHIVDGRAILPGVGHLDLVAREHGDLVGRALADVRWALPLAVSQGQVSVSVVIEEDRYEVRGAQGTPYSYGRITDAPAAPEAIDIAALRSRLDTGPDHDAFYESLRHQGLPYGPFFRRVQQVWLGPDEVMSRLGHAPDDDTYALHPGFLDAAIHTVAALLARRDGRLRLPFAADRVEFFGPVPSAGWSWVRETGSDRYDVLVLDDAGAVRVRFLGLTYRMTKPRTVPGYRPVWRARAADTLAEPARQVLLVGPDSELADAIAAEHGDVRRLRPGFTDIELDRELTGPDLVYFLASATEPEPDDRVGLHAITDRGVVSLFRVLRALDGRGLLDERLRVKVVTTDVHPLGADDPSAPWAAGLAGLAMVAGKECPGLRIALVDVRSTEAGQAAGMVVAEPCTTRPVPVSLRAGVRRVRELEPVELSPAPPALRDGGVYLVIGGLGTVGRDTCLHLARAYRAKLVVVGRSPLDERRQRIIDELTTAGAQVRYLALDAREPDQLATAIRVAHDEFGVLHGVFHAAMVLVNQSMRELSPERLREAFDAKADSTWTLLRALRGESLDFVLCYSSGVAFTGNHGQAGYAAGCAFADAYALHAARILPFPVRVLNLGYWHAGGDSERARVLRRVEAAGLRPLGAETGMAVLEQVLGSRLPQVFAFDADQRILADLGIDPDTATTVRPGDPVRSPKVRLAGTTSADAALLRHQRAVDELEGLVPGLVAAALRRAGVSERTVTPEHAMFFQALSDMVPDRPVLERGSDLDALIARAPGIAGVATLLRECLAALPEVLTGRLRALDVLFPNGSSDRVAAVYQGDPVTDHCNAEVARLVVEQVTARLSARPATTVRILEVGAGTGGTSATVLAALAAHSDSVEYVFTDVSPAFVRKARQRFGEEYSFARFEVLDIEADGASAEYDVVLGTNVFHATAALADTLTRTKSLLRAGGVLLLVEGTRVARQLALIFGLTAGWWSFTDPEQRLPRSPLASAGQWRDVLASCGFTDISIGSPISEAGPAFQSVIAAVSDGIAPATRGPRPAPEAERVTVVAAAQDGLAQVTAVFARVLDMAPEHLDPDLTFENYGVDSLVALELTRALEAEFGSQPATLLFEQITIRRLARHLSAEPAPPAGDAEPARPADDAERLVASLSDDEVEELLAELSAKGGGRG
ncbi:polyketide synthase PksN [Catenulispora sp. EB89]|uniref:SDR family NAD(P)-dependent oxidoreductase n=1 Tax=Catenulispora sp. EB89 TaxID=3156257 RepID=UPI003511DD36